MKTKLFLLALIYLCFASCNNDQEVEKFTNPSINKDSVNTSTTKAFSLDIPSKSNPMLHNNWENVTTIFLNGGGTIDAPWVFREGNSMNIPLNYRIDIKKEDGWKMLSHTMLDQSSEQPNYILFYNPLRGLVKGFYYNRYPIKNNSLIWVMEAKSPTTIFPSNKIIQNSLNSKEQYISTSNINEDSQFNFGHLNQGWNAFSFELSYSTVDNAPIVSIKAYNHETSNLTAAGDYSGEVIIPVPKEDPSGLKSLVSTVGKIANAGSSIIPQLKAQGRNLIKNLAYLETRFAYVSF